MREGVFCGSVTVQFEFEDINAVLEEKFNGASIDDLTEDELNTIVAYYEEYLEENAYDSAILAEIIERSLEECENTTIKR